ncbi:MAG: cobalamin biosynthesis protein [Alphaproteobacteria bacterium]|nr:cobalamin biosynthesis protein [Alphaproteobacteria bacterium]
MRKVFMLNALGNYLRNLLRSLDRRLNKSNRSPKERAIRGSIVLLVMLGLTGTVASSLSALSATHQWGWLGEVLILSLFIPQRLIFDEARAIYRAIKNDHVDEARKCVERLSLRDAYNLDKHGVIRSAIEYIASAFADRVLSPILWYILLGLPGFIASKIITEAALMLGYESRRHKAYGKTPGRLETVINYIPARIAAIIIVSASLFVPKAKPLKALVYAINHGQKVQLPRKGAPIAAAAGALNLALAGPRSVQGFLVKDAWVGKGSARVTLHDLKKMLLLYVIACLLNLAGIATLLFLMVG